MTSARTRSGPAFTSTPAAGTIPPDTTTRPAFSRPRPTHPDGPIPARPRIRNAAGARRAFVAALDDHGVSAVASGGWSA